MTTPHSPASPEGISDDGVHNLWNRVRAAKKADAYHLRTFVDVPTHELERMLVRLTAAERELAEMASLKDQAYDHWMAVRNDRDRLSASLSAAKATLVRLRDCDWTIGRGDRMDPVRNMARDCLASLADQEAPSPEGSREGA